MTNRKVLLLELNEVNWRVVDQLIAERGADFLKNFSALREQGTWAAPNALEQPPHLDPWVTWVTLYTGVPRDIHGASVLEQDSRTIQAMRLWDYASEAGRSVGVFGSISAYPPRAVRGFMVPGPFAPGDEVYPPELGPVQSFNRLYTQVHNRTRNALKPVGMAAAAGRLIKLGLRPGTVASAAIQLGRERLNPHCRWRRVALQPRINFDLFAHAYRRWQPQFATWHTNHAAHYMHHYWRAWDDSQFPVASPAEERTRYGEAVPFGYRVCDDLISRFRNLIDADTVLVVASSMGQQPYISDRYRSGKIVVRIKDIDRFVDALGARGVIEVVPTMVPQWNLRIPDAQHRADAIQRLEGIFRGCGAPTERAFATEVVGEILTITPLGLSERPEQMRYFFTRSPEKNAPSYAIDELFALDTPTVKQGMHHPSGLLAFIGPGIRRGEEIQSATNLDVAPTVLSIMGIEIPTTMKGSVLV
jgi:hypothetical protein